jgi:hypothetical protein
VAFVLVLLGWATGCAPAVIEHHDAASPEMRSLFDLVERPGREARGFAPLPKTDPVSISRLRRFRSQKKGGGQVALSAHIQTHDWSRAWYFARQGRGYRFLCETETIHGPSMVTARDGRAFREFVEIQDVVDGGCFDPVGYRVTHLGREGMKELPLGDGLAIARAWFRRPPSDPEQKPWETGRRPSTADDVNRLAH